MTQSKREPFAKAVALRYSDSGGQTYGVEVLGFKLAGNFNETGAMLRAMEINARVDEEVRKAVEEFRERAVEAIGDTPMSHSIFGSSEAANTARSVRDYLKNVISSLPTEPERGRE